MAKYLSTQSSEIDSIFHALSDPTRRDILERLSESDLTVSDIAKPYDFSLPTISKHVTVLENASLVRRHKFGRQFRVTIDPLALKKVAEYITFYKKFWTKQIGNIEIFLAKKQ